MHFSFLNVYSDSNQLALKYLKNTEVDIQNILIITNNFNIGDNDWDLDYSFHSTYRNLLFDIANSFNLSLFHPVYPIPTRYADNENLNLVIDLMFLQSNFLELDSYFVFSDQHFASDYALLVVDI